MENLTPVDCPAPSKPLGSHSMVALIPARAGSKRCPGKNKRQLDGKPLLIWSIEAARASGVFKTIIVSTDDIDVILGVGFTTNDVLIHDRKRKHATDSAPDFLWVNDVMKNRDEDIFCILRPTSPFRTASTIRRCYAQFIASGAHSIRAVSPMTEHPGKMWEVESGTRMRPLLDCRRADGTPWHSSPTQSLPPFYRQNASLEMCWTWAMRHTKSISGVTVCPFFTEALEGFDINTEADFAEAERLAATFTP